MTRSTTRSAPLCRLLQVVIALQSERRPNARQLAEEVGVSRRTIFRDLETIEGAGLRVEYDAARQGYRIASGGPAARGSLEEREVLALAVLANRGADRDPFGLTGPARSGLLKLVAGLPDGAKQRAEALDLATRSGSPAPPREEDRRLVYDRVLDAVVRGVHVRLRVRVPGGGSEATRMAPYRLVEGRDGWSVLGRSSLHRGVRLIPMARIVSAEPTDDPAPVPPRFRAEPWLEPSGADVPASGRSAVHLRFDAEVAPAISDGRWHASERVEPLGDGRVDLRLALDRPEDLAGWVLGHGLHVEVLAPARLRNAVRRLAAGVARRNAGPRRQAVAATDFGGRVVDAPRSATRIRLVE